MIKRKRMLLEDFRDNNFGRSALSLNTSPQIIINLKYDMYAIDAYNFTSTCLRDLEISRENLNNGTDAVSAITMWYLSLNSFIDSLLKVFLLRSGIMIESNSLPSLADRYLFIINILSHEVLDSEKNILEKLSDISLFYQNLHLDLKDESKLVFKTANFSSNPFFINQIDVFQCMMIALEVFERLRFVIKGIDMMPNITVQTASGKVVFEKLSVLHKNAMVPIFTDILSKHKLETKLKYFEKFIQLPVSNIFEENHVVFVSKIEEDEKYKWKLNSSNTEIFLQHYSNFVKKYEGREEQFCRNYLSKR